MRFRGPTLVQIGATMTIRNGSSLHLVKMKVDESLFNEAGGISLLEK
ncbi:MAG: hypothetical protein OCD76_25265 [Reichenbachiella sp.]